MNCTILISFDELYHFPTNQNIHGLNPVKQFFVLGDKFICLICLITFYENSTKIRNCMILINAFGVTLVTYDVYTCVWCYPANTRELWTLSWLPASTRTFSVLSCLPFVNFGLHPPGAWRGSDKNKNTCLRLQNNDIYY